MIYLKVNSKASFGFRYLKCGTLYKIEEMRVTHNDSIKVGTYYGTPKFYFDEISAAEVLVECHKRGITVADIKEIT